MAAGEGVLTFAMRTFAFAEQNFPVLQNHYTNANFWALCGAIFRFKLNNLKAIFFNFFRRPKSLAFGFENVSGDNFNFSSSIFFLIFVPFLQNQSIALIYLKIGKTQFQLFLAGNNFLKIFSPNFFMNCCHNYLSQILSSGAKST